MPITYFQTLVDHLIVQQAHQERLYAPARNDTDEDGLKVVDVDELARKGKLKGFSV